MRVFIPLLFLAFVACSGPGEAISSQESITLKKEKPNRIVLIFHQPVKNGFYTYPDGEGQSTGRTNKGDEIQYTDDHLILQRAVLHAEVEWDTVTIDTQRDRLEIKLMYMGLDDLAYLFENGDSVLFEYDGIKPVASILNRPEAYAVTNYSLMVRDSISRDLFPAMKIVRTPFALMHRKTKEDRFDVFLEDIRNTALSHMSEELEDQYTLLEKLSTSGEMPVEHFRYRLANLLYGLKNMEVTGQRNPERSKVAQITKEIERLNARFPEFSSPRSDSLLVQMNYQLYLQSSITEQYAKQVTMLERNGRGAGARTPDHLKKYDLVRLDTQLTALEKKTVQHGTLSLILSQPNFFSAEQRLRYLTYFKNDFQDSVMTRYLIDKYKVEYVVDDEIKLANQAGEETTLSALVAQHKGKVVYIDYWASWCGPCLGEMPDSKKVQAATAGQDVVYIYLSKDLDTQDWARAIDKYALTQGLHYNITNANSSSGYEALGVFFIPRYMIYDKKGKLVNNDAPRPSEWEALKAEFAKYL